MINLFEKPLFLVGLICLITLMFGLLFWFMIGEGFQCMTSPIQYELQKLTDSNDYIETVTCSCLPVSNGPFYHPQPFTVDENGYYRGNTLNRGERLQSFNFSDLGFLESELEVSE